MLVAIDVGNTQTLIGLFDGDDGAGDGAGGGGGGLTHHWRVSTRAEATADELALQLDQLMSLAGVEPATAVTGIAVASVVPRLRAGLREMTERWWNVATVIVEPGIRTGMPILYDNPREVGADRIADAVAAFDRYGGPTVVIDFGTATTFEAVSARGEYLGGAILPGIEISMEALFVRASALTRVELVEVASVIGKNTVESLQAGAVFGFAAQVDGMCARFAEELGPCTVVATGGLAGLIAPVASAIDHYDPWLTLDGLRIIFGRNQPK
ncbi:MAG: type III pantothenate kinase [Acidimicrobiales bacterium]